MSVKVQDLRSVLQRYHYSVFSCLARLTEERRGRLQDSRYALELVRLSTFSFFSDAMQKYEVDLPIPLVALVNGFVFYNPVEAKLRCIACSRSFMLEEAIAMIRKSGNRFNPATLHQDDCPLTELIVTTNSTKKQAHNVIDERLASYFNQLSVDLADAFAKRLNVGDHVEVDQFTLRRVDICTYDSSKFAAYCEHLGKSAETSKPTVVEQRSCFRKQRYGRPASDVKEIVMVSEQTRLDTFLLARQEKTSSSSTGAMSLLLAVLLVRAGMYLADNKLRCAFCRKAIKMENIMTQFGMTLKDRACFANVLRQLAIVHCRLRARCPMVMNLLFDNVPFTPLQLAEIVEKMRCEIAGNDDYVLFHSPPENATPSPSPSKMSLSGSGSRANTLPSMRPVSKVPSSTSSFKRSSIGLSCLELTNPFGSTQTLDYTPSDSDKMLAICKSPASLQLAKLNDQNKECDVARVLPFCATEFGVEVNDREESALNAEAEADAQTRFGPADFCAKLLHAYRAGPEFSTERVRLETFVSSEWDEKLRPSAKWMSLAGFYKASAAPTVAGKNANAQTSEDGCRARYAFTGERRKTQLTAEDATLCFYCGGLLSRWAPNDDPFVRHAFNFPDCSFMLTCMGRKFVSDVQRLKKPLKGCAECPLPFANAYSSLRGFWKQADGEAEKVSEKLVAMYADLPVYRHAIENLAVPRQCVATIVEESLARGEEPPTKAFELLELVSNLKMRLAAHDVTFEAYHWQVDPPGRGNASASANVNVNVNVKTQKQEVLTVAQLMDILQHEDSDDRVNAVRNSHSHHQPEANESLTSNTDSAHVSSENKEQEKVCASCRKLEVEYVLDCRHVVCDKCKKKLGKNCPLPTCRQRIKKPKKINKN